MEFSEIGNRLGKVLARAVIRERHAVFRRVAKIQQGKYLLVFRKRKGFCQLVRIEEIDPAAADAFVVRCQHQMGGDNRSILDAGAVLSARILEDMFLIECNGENYRA